VGAVAGRRQRGLVDEGELVRVRAGVGVRVRIRVRVE